ncbi:MAG: rRNA maturation RNase YbeY [Bacteroidia bacterium]|nr:rRNA maturation RNase YbeY [Bacteroidia bacterium]
MKIRIFYDNINYRIKGSRKVLKFIEKVIRREKKTPGDLSFIITNDKELLKINKKFLGRDTLTDVIAFDYSDRDRINGEIYISIETVNRNSLNYKVSLREEVFRVLVHGTLHLCGYKDDNMKEKMKIAKKEDFWIAEFKRTK